MAHPPAKSRAFQPFDVVVAPFPFSDMMVMKRRPAVVISAPEFSEQSGHYVLAMITSAKHSAFPLDVVIKGLKTAGLPGACMVRMKLFTAHDSLLVKKTGVLTKADQQRLRDSLAGLFHGVV